MARQQIEITDDAPIVQHRTSSPGGPNGGGMGGMLNGAPPLPKAGWMPYSQDVPGLRTNLPATNNGVPQKAPPPVPRGVLGQHAGRGGLLRPTQTQARSSKVGTTAAAANPRAVQAYSPYAQYQPSTPRNESPAAGSAAMQSNANVKGDVLHWARHLR